MEIQRHALVKRDYLVPFVLVTSLFFLWGFAHAILDVLNKHFQEVMDITRTHSAMVQVMFYLGYFIMAIPAGLFITKYGYRKGVVFGMLLVMYNDALDAVDSYFRTHTTRSASGFQAYCADSSSAYNDVFICDGYRLCRAVS